MLDELLEEKQIKLEDSCKIEGIKKVESEQKHIYMLINEADEKKEPIVKLDKAFEKELAEELLKLEALKERVEAKKEEILGFLDKNHPKGFETNMLVVKYTSATTQTSIDSTRLKKEMPEIAAKYSKTSPKKSSISINKADRVKVEE